MAEIVVTPLAGRTLGDSGGSFAIAEWADAGGPLGPPRLIAPLHVHHHDDEAWYVLEGTLKFRLGDQEVEAPAGSAVLGPREVPHTFWNLGPGRARYLVVMAPNTLRLIEELHTMSDRSFERMQVLFRKHGAELLAGL
jgi:mannose-6-phosphate isomerase-like protein (cupin superfamily)